MSTTSGCTQGRITRPSLLDGAGRLYSPNDKGLLVEQARVAEVEIELRAQIDTVLAAGLAPTQLDWHCLADGGPADLFDLSLALAEEYGLAARVWLEPGLGTVRERGLPVVDHRFLDSFALDPTARCPGRWTAAGGYARATLNSLLPRTLGRSSSRRAS
jgi:hypothetical protein